MISCECVLQLVSIYTHMVILSYNVDLIIINLFLYEENIFQATIFITLHQIKLDQVYNIFIFVWYFRFNSKTYNFFTTIASNRLPCIAKICSKCKIVDKSPKN